MATLANRVWRSLSGKNGTRAATTAMTSQSRAIFLFVLLLAETVACRQVRRAAGPPIPMVDGFFSFQTPNEAKSAVARRNLSWTVSEDTARDNGQAPFQQLFVEVKGFVTEGQSGDLILEFLNSRLMRIVFYPANLDRYLIHARERGVTVRGVPDLRGELELRTPGQPSKLRILIASDYLGNRYVVWFDTRLDDEYHDLVLKHS